MSVPAVDNRLGIRAKDLVVEFPMYGSGVRSLRNVTLQAVTGGRLTRRLDNSKLVVRALDGVSFDWGPGDRIGLMGNNGSGKTTLLRVLAGIYEPVSGSLEVNGRVASMLAISLGMDGEVSGYDNILVRGTVMGLSREETLSIVDEIVEFSELGDYIHMPMRTYSSGMGMRLAFAIATSITADIVLMDEWLSVGDAEFSQKAEARLQKMVDQAKILVLASHSPGLVDKVCDRVMILDHGKIVSDERK
jgi:lipopolysaccharide transport system ATP-binding protein